jgi:clan AA aspartic protease
MTGRVDQGGRALLEILLSGGKPTRFLPVTVWVDTGFTGELVLPHRIVEELRLEQSGTTLAVLADGKEVPLRTYTGWIQWFNEIRSLEIVGNEGQFPLLGIGSLLGHDLRIGYRSNEVFLD